MSWAARLRLLFFTPLISFMQAKMAPRWQARLAGERIVRTRKRVLSLSRKAHPSHIRPAWPKLLPATFSIQSATSSAGAAATVASIS
jgi:hypothetical protein